MNTIFASIPSTRNAVNDGKEVCVYLANGKVYTGKLEDTAPGGRVVVLTAHGDRHFGWYLQGVVFEQPKEGHEPKWVRVPLLDGSIVDREPGTHHWVPGLNVFAEVEDVEDGGDFKTGIRVEIHPALKKELPDLERRSNAILAFLSKKAQNDVSHGWERRFTKDGVDITEYDAVMIARVLDLGLTVLEIAVKIAKAIEMVVGAGSIFGIKDSVKNRVNKKIASIKARVNELG